MDTILSCCGAPHGAGGISQHFGQLVSEARDAGTLARYYATQPQPGDAAGRRVSISGWRWVWRYTPVRWSPGWTNHLRGELFDRKVAARLRRGADAGTAGDARLVAFAGQALRSFREARGTHRLELVVPNSHVDNLKRLHEQAYRRTGIRDTWLNEAQRRKTLEEYDRADVIHVHSEYVRKTFLREGVPAAKLRRTRLRPAERFRPPAERPDDDVFRVVYVGRVDATKGLPLLMEAFSEIDDPAELTIVGGWSTRAMRRYMQRRLERDARIRMAPGDPLPHLHRADVFVHPTFQDGFGYAPAEALACGVPVIVTEDTGMKEHVREGENGFVVPTGRLGALIERLEHLRAHPMTRTRHAEPMLPTASRESIPFAP